MKRYKYLTRFVALLSNCSSDIIFGDVALLMLKPSIAHDPESVAFMFHYHSLFPLD